MLSTTLNPSYFILSIKSSDFTKNSLLLPPVPKYFVPFNATVTLFPVSFSLIFPILISTILDLYLFPDDLVNNDLASINVVTIIHLISNFHLH